MFVLENDRVVFFDVDDTLVSWEDAPQDCEHTVSFEDEMGKVRELCVKTEVVERVIQHKQRGWGVIVWTQSGHDWAKRVVRALGIEEYVDVILTKPFRYYDDLCFNEWIGQWKDTTKPKYGAKQNDTD